MTKRRNPRTKLPNCNPEKSFRCGRGCVKNGLTCHKNPVEPQTTRIAEAYVNAVAAIPASKETLKEELEAKKLDSDGYGYTGTGATLRAVEPSPGWKKPEFRDLTYLSGRGAQAVVFTVKATKDIYKKIRDPNDASSVVTADEITNMKIAHEIGFGVEPKEWNRDGIIMGNLSEKGSGWDSFDPEDRNLTEGSEKFLEKMYEFHKRGGTHRDIHEGNVLSSREGEVALIDFGLSIHRDSFNTKEEYIKAVFSDVKNIAEDLIYPKSLKNVNFSGNPLGRAILRYEEIQKEVRDSDIHPAEMYEEYSSRFEEYIEDEYIGTLG